MDQSSGVARCAKERLGFFADLCTAASEEVADSDTINARLRTGALGASRGRLLLSQLRGASTSVCQNGDPGGRMRALVPSHRFQSCFIFYLSNFSS
jgi:hypothetical protein